MDKKHSNISERSAEVIEAFRKTYDYFQASYPMDETKIVAKSWNTIGPSYDAARNVNKIDDILEDFASKLHTGAKILDAGSGSGVPASRFMDQKGFEVTGIDISSTMLEMARRNVPGGQFLLMDMRKLEFPARHFDGITCLFALFHVARKYHEDVIKQFYQILKPGGLLLMNTGISGSEGFSRFFGEQMFWSNHPPRKTLEIVRSAGFIIEFEGNLRRGGEIQYWIKARKPPLSHQD